MRPYFASFVFGPSAAAATANDLKTLHGTKNSFRKQNHETCATTKEPNATCILQKLHNCFISKTLAGIGLKADFVSFVEHVLQQNNVFRIPWFARPVWDDVHVQERFRPGPLTVA